MKIIKNEIILFVILWIVVGIVYPLFITGIAKIAFPWQAGGSLIKDSKSKTIGSALIGQPFSSHSYFWPRPSATAEFPYNPLASGGSNLGPTNDELIKNIIERKKILQESGINGTISSDLVMASASGLDPHISLEAAILQVPRVAKARDLGEESIKNLIIANLEKQYYFIGNDYINIVKLNLDLDKMGKANGK